MVLNATVLLKHPSLMWLQGTRFVDSCMQVFIAQDACSDILSAIFEASPAFLCSAMLLMMTSQVTCNFLVTLFRTGPLNSYQTLNQLVQIY